MRVLSLSLFLPVIHYEIIRGKMAEAASNNTKGVRITRGITSVRTCVRLVSASQFRVSEIFIAALLLPSRARVRALFARIVVSQICSQIRYEVLGPLDENTPFRKVYSENEIEDPCLAKRNFSFLRYRSFSPFSRHRFRSRKTIAAKEPRDKSPKSTHVNTLVIEVFV